jgi:hypothetical protein
MATAGMLDVVTEEDRTTLVPGRHQRVVCMTLGTNVFDYGHKAAAADQMQTLWDKLIQYVGKKILWTIYQQRTAEQTYCDDCRAFPYSCSYGKTCYLRTD